MTPAARAADASAGVRVDRVIVAEDAQVTPTLVVKRALPDAGLRSLGPWVFLDHFGPLDVPPGDRGTPPHPHAGIETVTYLLDGRMHHRDSLGHEGSVDAGGVQWMTAGRGIVHAERPEGGRSLHGLQLWTRLPRAIQLADPGYQNLQAADLPSFPAGAAEVRVIGGELSGRRSPARARSPILLAHARFTRDGELALEVPAAFECALYVATGRVRVGKAAADAGTLLRLAHEGEIAFEGDAGSDVMLLGGAALGEPMVFHGPFVMDSVAAIRQAERDYFDGNMGTLAP